MLNKKFNPVTLLLLIASVSSTLASFADILPKSWLPFIVIGGAIATSVAKQLVSGQGSVSPVAAFVGLLLVGLVLTQAACTPNIRAVGRGLEAGAIEAKRELASMRKAGEIEPDTATKYEAVLQEIEANGHDLTLIVNWNAMTRAGKRATIRHQIKSFAGSAQRLDEAGVLGIKSERARKKVESFKRNLDRGLSLLRVIEAAIPQDEEKAQASPSSPTAAK